MVWKSLIFSNIVPTDDNTTTYQPMLFIFYEFHCYYDIYSTAVQIVEEIKKKAKKIAKLMILNLSWKKNKIVSFETHFFRAKWATAGVTFLAN